MCEFVLALFENILAGFILIIIIKIIALRKTLPFVGVYKHASVNGTLLDGIQFHVSIEKNLWYYLNPISTISIRIERKGDPGDWSAILNSDILNIKHFKGNYTIEKPEGGQDGWFDAYLFKSVPNKIGLHLHFIDPKTNKWVDDQGYYIYKEKNSNQ